MIQYLLSVTKTALDNDKDVELLQSLIRSSIYGIALELMRQYPKLSRELQSNERARILAILASKPSAFASGSRLGYWKRLIYHWIPVQEEHIPHPPSVDADVENSIVISQKFKNFTYGSTLQQIFSTFGFFSQKLHLVLWNFLLQLVPGIKSMRDTKLMHTQTLQIAKIMCHEGITWSAKEGNETLWFPAVTAVRLGICELVHEISKAFYYSYIFRENGHGLFHLAILHRQEGVLNILNKIYSFVWGFEVAMTSVKRDNILHIAGRLGPSTQVAGAALQMQRELQWYKVVESYVHPSLQEHLNSSDQTPREVFTKEHKDLLKEGEKWMKETASSCALVAALIITVVFAAAFTVPGGNNTVGIPMFLQQPSFLVFAVSDALALFSSTASLLMFLGILTSRYAEEDFLNSLPKKLIIGLITLFLSIASMMVAFGATIYLFLSHPWKWVIIPISLLGCVPVTLFAMLQFPLLVDMFLSTYGPSILKPRKVRM
ncbi:uncharacterized protein LOC116120225 [Pistacia vera]|uniref:uncharacterized protein LOC116120225 n=1 Tax=Pistacia vera TaxID=55513 RepID=UPI001263B3AD|nr:uncharacterized protein LOC116120225 [Pistacia vera]